VKDRWRHFPAIAIAIVFLLPLYFMVSGSLRKAGLPPPRTPELLPSPLAWGNYGRAFDLVDIPRYTLNSLLVVAFAVPLTIIVSSWAAFAR
jgi:multiple sugar transport system permease protein